MARIHLRRFLFSTPAGSAAAASRLALRPAVPAPALLRNAVSLGWPPLTSPAFDSEDGYTLPPAALAGWLFREALGLPAAARLAPTALVPFPSAAMRRPAAALAVLYPIFPRLPPYPSAAARLLPDGLAERPWTALWLSLSAPSPERSVLGALGCLEGVTSESDRKPPSAG